MTSQAKLDAFKSDFEAGKPPVNSGASARRACAARTFLQLPLPFRELARMYIELQRQFGQRSLTFGRRHRHSHLERS